MAYMINYYLAVDIGASSGRHILGWLENGKLKLEEVYRFKNGMEYKNGHLCWNVSELYNNILNGIKRCSEIGKTPTYMGIDTWAVDFVLLDKNDKIIGDCVGYRDLRTEGMDDEVYKIIPPKKLYNRTGIQKQIFNTIYQLTAIKRKNSAELQQAEKFLMIPDYFNFLLTGKKANEYTNASTTQLVSSDCKDWDWDIIDAMQFPRKLFGEIKPAGSMLGGLREEIKNNLGFDITVMLPATHDTGSAVLAVPSCDETIYLSSGTWSLMGIERMKADCSEKSMMLNYTNEGGYSYRFRYLKNIMGLWMIQSVKKEIGGELSFDDLLDMAKENSEFPTRVNVNDQAFLSPESMVKALQNYCENTRQQVPKTTGEILAVIYSSLADCYAETMAELEKITGKSYPCVNIVGGGCKDEYLNQLTANATGKTVFAGPVEATAIGNITAQMLGQGEIQSLDEARNIIRKSFPLNEYKPQ